MASSCDITALEASRGQRSEPGSRRGRWGGGGVRRERRSELKWRRRAGAARGRRLSTSHAFPLSRDLSCSLFSMVRKNQLIGDITVEVFVRTC
jgi:hypothetical protein